MSCKAPRARTLRDLFELDALLDAPNPPATAAAPSPSNSNNKTKTWQFRGRFAPSASGFKSKAAYGGSTMASALIAAGKTVPNSRGVHSEEDYHVYSYAGHFLGPATVHASLHFVVHETRTTRSYASRYVQVLQEFVVARSGQRQERQVFAALVDFQRTDANFDFLDFSAPPDAPLLDAADPSLVPMDELLSLQRHWSAETVSGFLDHFGEIYKLFEARLYADSVHTHNACGERPGVPGIPQEGRAMTDKRLDTLIRAREELTTSYERAAAVVYGMDAGLAFLPLTFTDKALNAAGPTVSADFAVRFFSTSVPIDQSFCLHEQKTVSASHGRVFSKGLLWDPSGRLQVEMSQQCVCRPPARQPRSSKL